MLGMNKVSSLHNPHRPSHTDGTRRGHMLGTDGRAERSAPRASFSVVVTAGPLCPPNSHFQLCFPQQGKACDISYKPRHLGSLGKNLPPPTQPPRRKTPPPPGSTEGCSSFLSNRPSWDFLAPQTTNKFVYKEKKGGGS